MFTSRCSAVAIMERMEGFAKGINFRVGRVKDFKMSLTRGPEGWKGRLQLSEPHLSLMEAQIPYATRRADHQLPLEEELPTTVDLNVESGLGLKGWVNPAWD
ncbi:unnamed protein product [Linum trigynum]|uniref:Uncharacterized protein n=1 Tax=Linum trigynum TaxID=586398 RepID=A0AAV2CXZ4_9ROSI